MRIDIEVDQYIPDTVEELPVFDGGAFTAGVDPTSNTSMLDAVDEDERAPERPRRGALPK